MTDRFKALPPQDQEIIKQLLTGKVNEGVSDSLKKLSLAGLVILGSLIAKQSTAQTQYHPDQKIDYGTVVGAIDNYTKNIFGNKAGEIMNTGLRPASLEDGSIVYLKLVDRFKLENGNYIGFKVNKNNKIDLIELSKDGKEIRHLDYDNMSGEQALNMASKFTIGRINQTLRDPSIVAQIQKENKMNKLRETIRNVIRKELSENAPSKPQERPGPAIAPSKPDTGKPKPRRPLGNPDVKPKPKASMNEAEMLSKIIKRFKSKKINELGPMYKDQDGKWQKGQNPNELSDWERGYQQGYNEGFQDAKSNKTNKFTDDPNLKISRDSLNEKIKIKNA